MVSRTSKLILINAVKHSESHNKRKEERDMWQLRQKEQEERGEKAKQRRSSHHSHSRDYHVDGNLYDSFKSSGYLNETAHSNPSRESSVKTSNKWATELMKYEDSLGEDRWGHGGYKELYPEEFHCERTKDSSYGEIMNQGKAEAVHRTRKKKRKREKQDKLEYSSEDSNSDITPSKTVRDKKRKMTKDKDSSKSRHKKHKNHKKHKHKKEKK